VLILPVTEYDEVNAVLRSRQLPPQHLQQPVPAGPAVNEDAHAGRRLHQGGVTLPHVQDAGTEAPRRSIRQLAPAQPTGGDEHHQRRSDAGPQSQTHRRFGLSGRLFDVPWPEYD